MSVWIKPNSYSGSAHTTLSFDDDFMEILGVQFTLKHLRNHYRNFIWIGKLYRKYVPFTSSADWDFNESLRSFRARSKNHAIFSLEISRIEALDWADASKGVLLADKLNSQYCT